MLIQLCDDVLQMVVGTLAVVFLKSRLVNFSWYVCTIICDVCETLFIFGFLVLLYMETE